MRSNQINLWWVKYFQKEKSSSILWYSWKRMAPDTMEGRAMKSGQFVRYFCPFTAAKSSHLLLCFSLEDWSPPWLQWLCLCGDGKHKSNSYHVCTPRCHSMWSPIRVHAIKINYVFLFLYWSIGMVPKSHPGEKMWQQRWVDPGTDHVCMSDVAQALPSLQGRVVCEFKFAPFSCLQRRQHQQVSFCTMRQITSVQVSTSYWCWSQDQSEKEFSVFIAQALQRVVNVVCYSAIFSILGVLYLHLVCSNHFLSYN